jgi:hypothetical protein
MFLQLYPFFTYAKSYFKLDIEGKIEMQEELISFYIEHYNLYDETNILEELKYNLAFDLHTEWINAEQYEICALYKDAIKNLRKLLNNSIL